MTSHTRTATGGQAWFGLVIAVATLAASLFLWSDAFADDAPETPDGMVRLSEINEGALLLKTMEDGVYVPAPMIATDIELDISGPIVRATVTQRFENPSDAWVEGTYVFPMPEDSGVDRLRMQIGDRFIEGEIHERQQARQIYERAREAGQRASLVEQERPNMFTTSVANIGPGETIIVQIEYQDIARLNNGQFDVRVPLAITPRYIPRDVGFLLATTGSTRRSTVPDADRITPPLMLPEAEAEEALRLPVTIRANLDAGFELGQVASRFHATMVRHTAEGQASIELANGPVPANRDFVLTWEPADRNRPSAAVFTEEWNGQTYLLAQILPPAELGADVPRRDRETIFVIDNSGSMAGTSMQQAREALVFALERLQPGDTFNVIRFDNTMEQVFPQAVPANWENVGTALEFARGLDAEGGTEMLPALVAALRDTNADDTFRVRQIVFLTDGAIGNEAQLFEAIHRGMGRSRLFPVGIGSAPNTYFMNRAARIGRGTFTHIGQVSDVAEEMEQLFMALERPVMTNLDVLFPQGALSEIWPAPLPDLYYGEPVVMTARLDEPQGVMILEGQTAGETWRQQLSLSTAGQSSGIATLFGRNRIRGIEETRFQGADMAQVDRGVLQTALDFHLVSRLTSLVAVDATPARPMDQALVNRQTPNMIPDGWDFQAVMDNHAMPVQHAGLADALLDQLRPGQSPNQPRLDENGLPLPATATPRELLTWLGALMMLLGLIWLMIHQERRLW